MEKKELIQGDPKKEEDAGRIINIVSHQLKRTIFCYAWKDCGLTTMQNRVLHYILAKSLENPVYQKDIEKEFRVSKSTVTEILQLMEKNGFIDRKSSKRDGRMKRIMPTEKANKKKKEVMENIRTVEEKLRALGYEPRRMSGAGVVATLGTALTAEQARLLKRFAPQVYLAYDGDSAGQHAILRGLEILEQEGVPARVLDFPDGLDPDEFIRRDGPEAFAALPAISPTTYRMRRARESHDLSTQEGRTEYAKACAKLLAGLEPVEMENHLQELMVQTGFSREVLLAQIGTTQPKAAATVQRMKPATPRVAAAEPAGEELRAQELLLSLMATGRLPADIVSVEDFQDPLLKNLYEGLQRGESPASLVEQETDQVTRARVSHLLFTPPSEDTNQLIRMAQDCVAAMRLNRMESRVRQVMQTINSLSGDAKKAALDEVTTLTQKIKAMKATR